MEKISVDEKTLIVTLDSAEWERYFPKGEFDISDVTSRISLREMLRGIAGDVGHKRVEISVFGRAKAPRSVFIKYI